MAYRVDQLQEAPSPAWKVQVDWGRLIGGGDSEYWNLLCELPVEGLTECKFRGVSYDRLDSVIQNGIDVEPIDSVIWCDAFSKAWEYGEMPKLILALDQGCLKRSFVEVELDETTDAQTLEDLRKKYPTEIRSECGTRVWFSRLSKDDRRVYSPYEAEYAWWIPGDPLVALKAILIFEACGDEGYAHPPG